MNIHELYIYTHIQAGFYASIIGGIIAAIPSHPFDVIKTCQQGDLYQKQYKTIMKTSIILYKYGGGSMNRFFSGCFWRTLNITATVYIANECRIRFSPYISKITI